MGNFVYTSSMPGLFPKEVKRVSRIFSKFHNQEPVWYRSIDQRGYGWEALQLADGTFVLRRAATPGEPIARFVDGILYTGDVTKSGSVWSHATRKAAEAYWRWYKDTFLTTKARGKTPYGMAAPQVDYIVHPLLIGDATKLRAHHAEHQLLEAVSPSRGL